MTTMQAIPVAATRPNPYEYLGHGVKGLTTVDDMLASAGADFEAYAAPTAGRSRDEIIVDETTGLSTTIEGEWVLDGGLDVFRADTNEIIGRHMQGYNIVQYATCLDVALDAATATAGEVSAIGCTDNGGSFFAAIDLGMLTLDPSGVADVIDKYLVLFASHNGKLPICIVPSNVRRPCKNILPSIGYIPSTGGVKAKHTKNVLDKLALVKGALGIAKALEDAFVRDAEKMMAMPSSETELMRLADKLWPLKGVSDKAKTQQATRKDRLSQIYQSSTCQPTLGDTRWTTYNALTEFMDHGRGLTALKRATAAAIPGGATDKAKARMLDLCLN